MAFVLEVQEIAVCRAVDHQVVIILSDNELQAELVRAIGFDTYIESTFLDTNPIGNSIESFLGRDPDNMAYARRSLLHETTDTRYVYIGNI